MNEAILTKIRALLAQAESMSDDPFHPQGVGMHGDGDVSGVLARVRVKSAKPNGPRTKTFKGETAWSDAQRYYQDALLNMQRGN